MPLQYTDHLDNSAHWTMSIETATHSHQMQRRTNWIIIISDGVQGISGTERLDIDEVLLDVAKVHSTHSTYIVKMEVIVGVGIQWKPVELKLLILSLFVCCECGLCEIATQIGFTSVSIFITWISVWPMVLWTVIISIIFIPFDVEECIMSKCDFQCIGPICTAATILLSQRTIM